MRLTNSTMRSILHSVLALLAFTLFSFTAIAQNLGVHPTTLNFGLAPGQSETQVIHLSNTSGKKIQFRTYLNDWVRDSVGGHIYYRADTLSRSCATWVTLGANFIELEPNESKELTVKLQAPDASKSKPEMKWAMLFIETVEEANAANSKQAQATVRNLLRIGVHIYQTPPSVTKKEVKVFDLNPSKDMANTYLLACQNTGEVMLTCKSFLELVSLKDGAKTKLDPIEFPMFPDQRRVVTFELPKNMEKGKYSVLAVVDGGEDMSLEAIESQAEVK